MALLKDAYDLTKYIEITQGTSKELRYIDLNDRSEAWNLYAQQKPISKDRANKAGEYAMDEGYIKPLGADIDTHKLVLAVGGIYLLHRTVFGIIPKGLWLTWAEKNSKLTYLIWLIIGAILGNIGTIASFVQHHLLHH